MGRAKRSENEAAKRRQADALRMRTHRANQPEQEASKRRRTHAQLERTRIANQTVTQTAERRQAHALNERLRILDQSEDEAAERRQVHARYKRIRVTNMTQHKAAQHRQANTQSKQRSRIRARPQIGKVNLDVLNENSVDENYLGPMNSRCHYCQSKNFEAERAADKKFTSCCEKGKIKLPTLKTNQLIVKLMKGEHESSRNFNANIRSYNSALAFASMGAQIVPPPGYGPYCFRIHGQIYHRTGPMHPAEGSLPQYAQIYILDTVEALNARLGQNSNSNCLPQLMDELGKLMHEINPFAGAWKMMRDFEIEEEQLARQQGRPPYAVSMSIINENTDDQRRYNAPRCNEVAIIFQNQMGEPPFNQDIRIHSKSKNQTQQISFLHKKCDAMTYPLLFPYGDSGWTINVTVGIVNSHEYQGMGSIRNLRPELPDEDIYENKISQLQYYAYRLAIRDEFNPLLNAGKLTQQFIVDSYVKIESNRLNYIRMQQKALRSDSYGGVMDHINNFATNQGLKAGTPIILPSSFAGSPRAMNQNFQDAMSIVRCKGKPAQFVAITCNPNWSEITENLEPWQRVEHRPDLVARVFNLKFKKQMIDVLEKKIFGNIIAYVYVIEFQKRGLPHAHVLFFMDEANKPREPEEIDNIVCAEIPNSETHPRLHKIIMQNMIHGPCGEMNPNSVCMSSGECTKKYPKDFNHLTNPNVNGYPAYNRRNTGDHYKVGRYNVDNRWVVPYNPYLSLKYNCHINVEICASIKSVKYLFKYVYKAHDCANIKFDTVNWDEPSMYMDSRYISAPEAVWRIRKYKMDDRSHTIKRLTVHLESQQPVYFQDGEEEAALAIAECRNSTLQAYFDLNKVDASAHKYLYAEIPEHYVWDKQIKNQGWRKRNTMFWRTIGRIYTVAVSQGELYYLRLLLLHVRGPTSFQHLRTVDGNVYNTFKEAAITMQLLSDDSQWESCLMDAITYQMPFQLRNLFVTMCVFGELTDPNALWEKYKNDLMEDYLHVHPEELAEHLALLDIEDSLSLHRKSCLDFNLPVPRKHLHDAINEFDLEAIKAEALRLTDMLNEAQKFAYHSILSADTAECYGKCFFLDGPGGSGKTFLYNALAKTFQAQGRKVCAVASTGLAATLLEDASTYHSRFGLGIDTNETTTSKIKPTSNEAELLREADIVIWDEVTMTPCFNMDAVETLFRDITGIKKPFGNKLFVIGGDFRQTLPVIKHGSRVKIVQTSVKRSQAWQHFCKLKLHQNMRTHPDEIEYNKYLLNLGDGKLKNEYNLGDDVIEVPSDCIEQGDLITSIFGSQISLDDASIRQLAKRAILTPKNKHVHENNNDILNRCNGESVKYYSIDSVVEDGEFNSADFPIEFLNSLTPSGVPPHELNLKVGAIVMLLRNFNKKRGLCNGTRLIIKSLKPNVILAEIFEGKHHGTEVLIPRIYLVPGENDLPIKLKRLQFPIVLAFAMTINKAQGQSLEYVGIYLPAPVFCHGQLYVAFSRSRRKSKVRIKMKETEKQGRLVPDVNKWFTVNCVYKEIFD